MSEPGILKNTVAGGAGGACLVLVGHPLDTIKVRMQTMKVVAGEAPPYANTLDCALKTIRKEGPLALYRGMLAPLYGVTPMYSLCFFGYGVGKKLFCKPDTYERLDLVRIGMAGATSGIFTTPIMAPLERVKCVLQIQGSAGTAAETKYKGANDALRGLYKSGGIRSLCRGWWSTMLRDSLASFFYFSTYAVLRHKLVVGQEGWRETAGTLMAGGCAGIMNWVGCLPVDTLKSRYQTAPEGRYPNGIRSVFAEIMAKEGITSLWRGAGPVFVRAFPANAACFFGVETTLKALDRLFPANDEEEV